ncbi:MAG: response regulator transcription factor [Elusimicrobiales bacterium]
MDTNKNIVLVVDDDANFAEGLCETLELEGFNCAHAGTAADGIRLAAHLAPDAALTDFQLPDATGFAFCASIKKVVPSASVILMTGRSLTDEEKKQGFALGAGDYLTKPFDVRELAAAIRRLLSQKEKK